MASIFRVTLTQLLFSQTCQNVLHFTGPSSDPLQMQALADEVQSGWVDVVRPIQPFDINYVDIGVRLLESQFAQFHKTVNLTGGAGGQDHDDPTLAAIWRLRGASIGKKNRGRVYIPGMDQGYSSKGLILQPHLTAWANRQATILGTFGPNGSSSFRLVLCPSKPPFHATEVVSMGVAPTWGHQRRRNIGIGI